MGVRQPIVVRTPDLRTDLPPAEAERVRLRLQLVYMRAYCDVLNERILAFL